MKEMFCYGCEHVWADNKEVEHCPDCGCTEVEVDEMDMFEEEAACL